MQLSDYPTLVLISELLDAPSPSGREERVAAIVRKKVTELGYDSETDGAGNVLVRIEGQNQEKPMVFAAHMDEIGLVVTAVNDDGTLSVDRSGGLNTWKIGETAVEIVGDGDPLTGILSYGSTHTAGGQKEITWNDFKIITGLSPKQLTEAGVRPGSTAVPVRAGRGPLLFGDDNDPMAAAWTFDDRAGVAALIRLLKAVKEESIKPSNPVIVAFTVHEEGGCHGAKVLADRERPEFFIAIDGCPIPPGSPLKLDGTPGIWSKDRAVHFDQQLIGEFLRAAEKAGTVLQPAVFDSAASDASAVYSTGGAPRVATVGIVRENSHGYEVTKAAVFENLAKTLTQFLKDFGGTSK